MMLVQDLLPSFPSYSGGGSGSIGSAAGSFMMSTTPGPSGFHLKRPHHNCANVKIIQAKILHDGGKVEFERTGNQTFIDVTEDNANVNYILRGNGAILTPL